MIVIDRGIVASIAMQLITGQWQQWFQISVSEWVSEWVSRFLQIQLHSSGPIADCPELYWLCNEKLEWSLDGYRRLDKVICSFSEAKILLFLGHQIHTRCHPSFFEFQKQEIWNFASRRVRRDGRTFVGNVSVRQNRSNSACMARDWSRVGIVF